MKNLRSLSYNFCFLYPMLIDYTDLQREVVPSDTRNTGHSMDGSVTGRQNTKNIYIRSAHFITDYRGNEYQREYLPTAGADNSNLPGMGGVFNTTKNSHLYHYAGNNPVKYTDPDGKAILIEFRYKSDLLNRSTHKTYIWDNKNNCFRTQFTRKVIKNKTFVNDITACIVYLKDSNHANEIIDALNENGVDGDVLYACGPIPMLKALKDWANEKGIECQISLEERMACGIGACLACVCKTKEKDEHSNVCNKRICKDGPVFDANEIDF